MIVGILETNTHTHTHKHQKGTFLSEKKIWNNLPNSHAMATPMRNLLSFYTFILFIVIGP